ncbi:MAG: hypothetical protein HY927_08440 [Elusimicrobia bacterium]|nr:hypothetical protein [Elusimicrobiota bacterium]
MNNASGRTPSQCPRRMGRLLLALSILGICIPPGSAADRQIDFDQGIDAGAFFLQVCADGQPDMPVAPLSSGRRTMTLKPLVEPKALPDEIARLPVLPLFLARPILGKSACGRIPPDSCAVIPPLPEDPLAAARNRVRELIARGSIFGPFAPIITNNPAYLDALQYPPLLSMLPPEVGGPLLSDWNEIESAKPKLLSIAEPLDIQDQKLYDDGIILDAWKKRIDDRDALIEEESAQFEAQCRGQLPDPEYQICLSWFHRFNLCIDARNAEVRRYNAKVAAWNTKRDEIASAGDELTLKVKRWENDKIIPFNAKSEKATQDAQMTSVVFQAQGGGLQKSEKINVLRPVTVQEGLQKLDDLWAQLTDTERETRDKAIAQARDFVWETSTVGGVTAPPKVERNFHNPGVNPGDARIDVVLFRGRAFVFTPAAK